jgi:hypothetical protein
MSERCACAALGQPSCLFHTVFMTSSPVVHAQLTPCSDNGHRRIGNKRAWNPPCGSSNDREARHAR